MFSCTLTRFIQKKCRIDTAAILFTQIHGVVDGEVKGASSVMAVVRCRQCLASYSEWHRDEVPSLEEW